MASRDVVEEFNACINRGDLDGLAALMTDDHRFIDSEGAEVSGKQRCLEAWRGFFAQFPDYRNTFTDFTERDSGVVILGYSTCTTPVFDGPAIWSATVRDDKVASWRVYHDTPAVRAQLGLL